MVILHMCESSLNHPHRHARVSFVSLSEVVSLGVLCHPLLSRIDTRVGALPEAFNSSVEFPRVGKQKTKKNKDRSNSTSPGRNSIT